MVRQNPEQEGDSGWIFYGGGETQEYMDNSDNISIYSVNTIANYDPEIIEYLTYPPGTEIERNREGQLQVISKDVSKPDVIFFYPLNEGIAQITESWSFEISTRMLRRYDKGSLVIWRPGFTIWLNAYSPNNIAIEERAEKILETMSSDNQDLLKETKNGIQKIRYRLVEEIEGIKQSSAYIFGLTDNQEIHITIYYDDPKHMVGIEQIWDTLRCKCT
jgi:hypothetical protein